MMGLKKAKLENYFSLFSEPLLANAQLGGGTSFSNPLNKCCNYLLLCVSVCVCVAAEGNTSATEAHERLMLSSHWNAAAAEVSLCYCYRKVRGNTSPAWLCIIFLRCLLDLSWRELITML